MEKSRSKENYLRGIRKRRPRRRAGREDQINEMLKLCLEKVCELQAEIEEQNERRDPEAEGYAACAMETFEFLANEGLAPNHPIVKELRERLARGPQ